MELSREELETVAEVFDGISNRTRIAVLLGVAHDESMVDVAETVGVSRTAVQKQLDRLIESGLVYRPGEGAQRYRVTPLGQFLVTLVEQYADGIVQAVETAERIDREEREKQDVLTGEALEQAVAQVKWPRVSEELEDALRETIDE